MMKLLACLDFSQYATSVTDHAAWLADGSDAKITLLHVIQRTDAVEARRDLSGAIGLGARSGLMAELVAIEGEQSRIEREQGAVLLDGAAARLREAGINNVETLQRHGDIVETVVAQEEDADLVVIGKRGEHADFAKGHLGGVVERIVRQSVRPVLVASRAFAPIETVLVAYDGGESAARALDFVASSPRFADAKIHVVTVGDDQAEARLADAADILGDRLAGNNARSGNVEAAIKEEAQAIGADLLVMGAYGHSPLRRLILGSTTSAMLRALHKPVLLFR
ncbi:MAG: universal stress protein [Sphingomonas sp.]|nr:universal stress protein [Sphingomonas sp.]RZV52307.1 MAG: universal stress protein [Sphingomonadaceae bacterium]